MIHEITHEMTDEITFEMTHVITPEHKLLTKLLTKFINRGACRRFDRCVRLTFEEVTSPGGTALKGVIAHALSDNECTC